MNDVYSDQTYNSHNIQFNQNNLMRYKEIKRIIVSDSGPICQFDEYMHPQNLFPASIKFFGQYMFFFSKKYTSFLNKFVLNEINMLEMTQAENENFEIAEDEHDQNVFIQFAQEGEQKGK